MQQSVLLLPVRYSELEAFSICFGARKTYSLLPTSVGMYRHRLWFPCYVGGTYEALASGAYLDGYILCFLGNIQTNEGNYGNGNRKVGMN